MENPNKYHENDSTTQLLASKACLLTKKTKTIIWPSETLKNISIKKNRWKQQLSLGCSICKPITYQSEINGAYFT